MVSMTGVKRLARAVALVLAVASIGALGEAQTSNGAKPKAGASTGATTGAKPECVRRVEDTSWTGRAVWKDGDIYDWTLTFRADGVLVYSYRGSTYNNGQWTQRGVRVDFSMNDHYADYTGRLSGDTISGTQTNKVSNTGTWSVTRPCVGGVS